MATKIFVNLAVKDLGISKSFYAGLGFSINPQFSNEQAACIVVSEDIYVMILVQEFFKTFTSKAIADTRSTTAVLNCLSAESRGAVDDMKRRALVSGGCKASPAQDHGFMYSQSFENPDGHIWEVMWMATSQAPPTP